MFGEVSEHQGSLVVTLNKPFLDSVLAKIDAASIAKVLVDKIKDEIICSVISTYNQTALKDELTRQIRQDVGRVVLSRYDHRIRAAVEDVMRKVDKDFDDDRTKLRSAEINKRRYAARKAKREAEGRPSDACD